MPARSRMARCSALMIGDHQRASHSASRRVMRSPYSSSSGALDSYQLRPLPAGGLDEHRPERALAGVERGQANVAVGLPLLAGMDDPVHLVEALRGPGADVGRGLVVLVQAGDVGGVDVDLRLAVDHLLGHGAPDTRSLLDPHGGRGPQPGDLRRLAEQRQAVAGDRQQPVDRVLHPHALVADDLRHQLEGDLHLRIEVVLGERQLGRSQRRLLDRGDLGRVHEDRAVCVGPDLEPRALLALVHVDVHVAHDRVLDHARGLGEPGRRPDVDHLVHRRGERDRGAGHGGDQRAPDAAADDDRVGLDVTARSCARA